MAAWQEGDVISNGVKLHYTRTGGGGIPIVLVHGITANRLSWSRLARKLQNSYDLIMYDARGHGLSEKPESGYAPVDHMLDLAGFIVALDLQKPVVIGHSMGGVTCAMVTAEYPELVRAAILEDPVWRWPLPYDEGVAAKRTVYDNWYARLAYRKTLSHAEGYARGQRERPLWSPEDLDAEVESKEQVSMNVLEYILLHDDTWVQQVVKFQSPVQLIYGYQALGGIVGPDIAAEARWINPLVQPVQIAGAGHNIRSEKFDEYYAVVREFLASIQRKS
jgi:N-formylmaleamate deformylase